MTLHLADTIASALRAFAIEGELLDFVPLKRGHIHDTYISTWRQESGHQASGRQESGRQESGTRRYLHQRVNERVFPDIPGLMHNVELVTEHLRENGASAAEGELEFLTLVPTADGQMYLTGAGGFWRTYDFIEGTETFDVCEGPERARETARAFGHFQAGLLDLDPSGLIETIPDFFSSPHRWRQLARAAATDRAGRVAQCGPELAFIREREELFGLFEGLLAAGRIPTRVIHGDTKLNNVLFDVRTRRPRCICDLDTCMPGWSLYDFGDLVRFTAATSEEDETDLERAGMDLELYRALVDGFLESARGFLVPEEVRLMPEAARLVTLTLGARFLADHLDGDRYFGVGRPGQNLDRARVQLRMVESMERQTEAMTIR